jgi:hypothetical protein
MTDTPISTLNSTELNNYWTSMRSFAATAANRLNSVATATANAIANPSATLSPKNAIAIVTNNNSPSIPPKNDSKTQTDSKPNTPATDRATATGGNGVTPTAETQTESDDEMQKLQQKLKEMEKKLKETQEQKLQVEEKLQANF